MKIYRSVEEILVNKNFVATIGTFDGVHLGHKVVLGKLTEIASFENAESLVITFFPHPRLVLNQDDSKLNFITSLDEKLELLEKAGIQHVLLQSFTHKFSQMSGMDFIQNFLIKELNVCHLIIGYDHHFGNRNLHETLPIKKMLADAGLSYTIIEKQEIDEISVSSTKIRQAIIDGNIETANVFLGYNFSLTGVVVHGRKIGRTIGFPTANLLLNDSMKIIPGDGVYAVKVKRNENSCFGMLNIGKKPTVDGNSHSVEVYIFDLNEDIYGEEIKIEFVKKIRNEEKFESILALKNQLEKDLVVVKEIFRL